MYKFLFPVRAYKSTDFSIFLLALRILVGTLFMLHGIQKWANFDALSHSFPDPLLVGSSVSLIMAIFGEVVCSLAFIFGFLYRLSMIPMMFTMIVAFFVIHSGDPLSSRELSFVYLMLFIIMYIPGPGRYSLDRFISGKLIRKNRR